MAKTTLTSDADAFSAAEHASRNDHNVCTDDVLRALPKLVRERLAEVEEKLFGLKPTFDPADDPPFNEDRQRLHEDIINRLLSDQVIARATPSDGVVPSLVMLGGRGGSGKSWFRKRVYDPDRAVVIDADEIKGMLPEYEGWNAAQVHEESSFIAERIVEIARELRLNVVIDMTMKTLSNALSIVSEFKRLGYRFETYYMFLPRAEAAKRAAYRFVNASGRYVPVSVVLMNTENERNFDVIRGESEAWQFYDNNVGEGQQPVLVAKG